MTAPSWPLPAVSLAGHARHLIDPEAVHPHPDHLGIPGGTGPALCGVLVVDMTAARAAYDQSSMDPDEIAALPECEECAGRALDAIAPHLQADQPWEGG